MMMDNKPITFSFMTEKREGHGEDAPPILLEKGEYYAVGVFDGMGGAGASLCNSAFGEGFTNAYVASRIVKDAVQSYMIDNLSGLQGLSIGDMKNVIVERLNKEKVDFPSQKTSMLRSKIVREYPTTMAVATMYEKEDKLLVDSYWAGDSHCYLWTEEGFYLISTDDLEECNDPMENLHNDSPVSNCICADRDFMINHKMLSIPKQPAMIICATDGCFGYYQTPMHFEKVLVDSLKEANDVSMWQQLIEKNILSVTGDDCSMSLIAVGYNSFEELKKSKSLLSVAGFPQLNNSEEWIEELKKGLKEEQDNYRNLVESSWCNYKQVFMKYIKEEDNGNA